MKKSFVLIAASIFATSLSFAQTKKTTVPTPPAKPVITELELKVEVDKEKEIILKEHEVLEEVDNLLMEKTQAIMMICEDIVEPTSGPATSEKPTAGLPKNKGEEIFNVIDVDQKPHFVGGESEMYKWLSANIMYPPEALERGATGKIIVSFVIEKDGRITNARIVRGKDPSLDKEALRIVKKMPNWEPALHRGVPVRCEYTLPITFNL